MVPDRDARYRRIIDSYRTALREVDPHACRLVDARMAEFGEGWISEGDKSVDVDAVKTASEIAAQFGFTPWDIQNWHRRHPDLLPCRGKLKGKNLYRVGDVLAVQVRPRGG
jgi:hypothetical protein